MPAGFDMIRTIVALTALWTCTLLVQSAPMQQASLQEYGVADRFSDREFERELGILLQNAINEKIPQWYSSNLPCPSGPLRSSNKRNSEIINSLLGIPKSMNDAGR